MEKNIWAVIPAYNEEKNIKEVVGSTKNYVDNVVVVDDGSLDNTNEAAKLAGAVVLRHLINLGKGAALKTGCDYALNKEADIIVILDADGQHEPSEIRRLIENLDGNDIVFSSRRLNKKMPFVLRMGNLIILHVTKSLFRIELSDSQCGFRAFTADAYKKIRWDAPGYAVENEIIFNVWKKHLNYKEMPIKTIYTDHYKGTTIIDGVTIVLNMLWWRITK